MSGADLGGEKTDSGRSAAGVGDAPRRRVHYSRGGLRGGGGQLSITSALIPLFLLWGAAAAIGAFFALGRFAWMPAGVRAAVVTVVFVAAAGALFRVAVRGYRRVTGSMTLPMEMDPDADVNVICWPDQKAELERLEPDEGTAGAFEPEVFRVWIASRTPMVVRMLRKDGTRREALRVVLLVLAIQGTAFLAASGTVAWEPVVAVLGLGLLTPFLRAFVVPTYLRVVPGRVDVVRFRLLRSVASVERIDLRGRPVRLDAKRKELLVGGWHERHGEPEKGDAEQEADVPLDAPTASKHMLMANQSMKDPQASLGSARQVRALRVVPLWGALEIGGAVRAVFRAAVSTAEPGPVPDDALL